MLPAPEVAIYAIGGSGYVLPTGPCSGPGHSNRCGAEQQRRQTCSDRLESCRNYDGGGNELMATKLARPRSLVSLSGRGAAQSW